MIGASTPAFRPRSGPRTRLIGERILGEQAGIASCSPNDLRRTYAKWMRLARVPAEIVAPTMGHRDTRTA